MESGHPKCLDADEKIDLGKIKKAKIYQATMKVYKAELTPELENQFNRNGDGRHRPVKSIASYEGIGL